MRKNQAMEHQVAVLAMDGAVAFDVGVPPQVFNAARHADRAPLYAVTVCTPVSSGTQEMLSGAVSIPYSEKSLKDVAFDPAMDEWAGPEKLDPEKPLFPNTGRVTVHVPRACHGGSEVRQGTIAENVQHGLAARTGG